MRKTVIKRKHIFISEKIHDELKREAINQGKKINMAFADDIVSIGLFAWRASKKNLSQ